MIFFFGVSHFCARIGQWVDEKPPHCKFIGFDWLRMPKVHVALLNCKKNIAHNVIIWHIQETLFGMLIYKLITVRFPQAIQKFMYIMKNRIFRWAFIFIYFMSYL